MSLIDRLRPRWKHSNPHVRMAAVATLTDEAVLQDVFETDPEVEIRGAAFERIADEEFLSRVARGESEFNLRAAARVKDQKWLGVIATHAASAQVRAAVVPRIQDDELLQRIASLDLERDVRQLAKQRHEGPDRFRDYLKTTLSKLQVAQRKADRMAEFCGTLDDVCGALVANSRFRIHGVVAEPPEITISSTANPEFSCVELLAGRPDGVGPTPQDRLERVVYRIKIWRQGENDFSGAVEERRYEMSSDVVAWGDSSKSD